MPIDTLLALLFKIVVFVAIGFLLKKKNVIDDAFQKKLGDVLLKAVMPLSVLVTGNAEYSKELSANLLKAAIIAAIYYVCALCIMLAVSRPLRGNPKKRGVFINMSVFANTAFLGFPLSMALYGEEGLRYNVIYNLFFQLLMFTVGVILLERGHKIDWKKIVTDPLTIASIASIVLFLSPLRFPAFIVDTMSEFGAMSVPLAMMVVGCQLSKTRFRSIWMDKWSYLVSALRLLVFPALMLVILYQLGFSGILPCVCVLITGMPVGAINIILAERHNADLPFATQTLVQSMVLMIITMPVMVLLLDRFFL